MSNGHPLFVGNAYSEQNRMLFKTSLARKKTKTKEKTEWGVGKAEDVAQLVQYLPNTHKAWWTCLQSDISRPGSKSLRAN